MLDVSRREIKHLDTDGRHTKLSVGHRRESFVSIARKPRILSLNDYLVKNSSLVIK